MVGEGGGGMKGRKRQARFERRVKAHDEMVDRMPLEQRRAYTRPGSFKKSFPKGRRAR